MPDALSSDNFARYPDQGYAPVLNVDGETSVLSGHIQMQQQQDLAGIGAQFSDQ
jgi:hypothetical protein